MISFAKVAHEQYMPFLVGKMKEVEKRDELTGLIDEVVTDLTEGLAHLFVGNDCGAVLRPRYDGDVLCLYVVFGWSGSGKGISDYITVYERLAHDIGASRIVSKSAREGVFRLWRKHGFKRVGIDHDGLIMFAKELSNG